MATVTRNQRVWSIDDLTAEELILLAGAIQRNRQGLEQIADVIEGALS